MVFSELRNREFYRQTIHLLLPVMLQQLITVGINFLDNIMVGSFGETQIAAAAFGNQFYSLFQFICMGLGSGAVVLSSQFWGRQELKPMKTVAAIAMQLTLALCALFTLVSVGWPELMRAARIRPTSQAQMDEMMNTNISTRLVRTPDSLAAFLLPPMANT